MTVRPILKLGNPRLYEVCDPVEAHECDALRPVIADLHDTMMDFRERMGAGRAIAAPQIGVMKRLVYMHIDEPVVFINPRLVDRSTARMTLWDDCMSFPELLVRVQRHRSCRIVYRDVDWKEHAMDLRGDLSELLQHETDHLDGVLAVDRAYGAHPLAWRSARHWVDDSEIPDPAAEPVLPRDAGGPKPHELRVETTENPSEATLASIRRGLHEYNVSQLGEPVIRRWVRLAAVARDEAGEIVGGAFGDAGWEWLHVDTLWVREDLRGRGIGSQVLAALERAASVHEVRGSHLETTDFQALDFYRKQGYRVFGTLKDKPEGHTWYYLRKEF